MSFAFDIGKIVLIVIIYAIICGFIIVSSAKQYIINNWGDYKCQPYIMPVAGLFGKSTVSNFTSCLFSQSSTNHSVFMAPLHNITHLMGGVMGDFTGSLNSLRNMGAQIRKLFGSIGSSIINRISDTASTLQFTFVKMTALFERLFGIFTVLIYTMLTTVELMTSTINGPIGSLMNTFCFDKNTLINMEGLMSPKRISDLFVNNSIEEGKEIISIIKIKTNNQLFNYNGTIVSGSHLVKHCDKWIRVDNTGAEHILDNKEKVIYCLTTKHNIIKSGGNIFRDYIETSNNFINRFIKQCFLKSLNNQSYKINNFISKYHQQIKQSPNNNYYISGFSEQLKIKLYNTNEYKTMDKLQIGDVISNNNQILGIVIHQNIPNFLYNLNGILVSGEQIIKFNNQWQLVEDLPNIDKIHYDGIIINLITSSNTITLGDYTFRDFNESNDKDVNEFTDSIIYEFLQDKNVSI